MRRGEADASCSMSILYIHIYIYTSVAVLLKLGLRWGSTMCVLAMSFSFVYYPLLLFFLAISIASPLLALYFAPGRGCFIAATLCLLSTATMASPVALGTCTISMTAICGIAMAVLYFKDLLWPFALFILSAFFRYATTILCPTLNCHVLICRNSMEGACDCQLC